MLAAFLEWFLWLAAFLYCLVKIFQKAEHKSIKFLAVVMMVLFTLLRWGFFIPIGKRQSLMVFQMHLPSHYDSNASTPRTAHAVLP